jgi:aminoglycoside phosphotransferase
MAEPLSTTSPEPTEKVAREPRHAAVPASVAALAGRGPVRAVWENQLGGLTFDVGTGARRCFVKWAPRHSGIDHDAEAARLEWAQAFTPAPRVLGQGADEAGAWLVTSPIPGTNAVTERWRADPRTAVTAVGRGLRALHETLPVDTCPFSWSQGARVADARRRAAQGRINPVHWHEDHRHLALTRALELLDDAPPIDAIVACHGDACAPNTVLSEDGRWSGHVDFGSLGVADRWADLAVATWSTRWNYGPGWEDTLLHAYGVEHDPVRTAYYRLLWDLGP